MLLALMLCVALACGSQVSAGIIPGIDGPTTGGVGDVDGDHPWGGDRAPAEDLVLVNTGTSTFTMFTGIPVIDILVTLWTDSPAITDEGTTLRGLTEVTTTRSTRASAVSSSSSKVRKALR